MQDRLTHVFSKKKKLDNCKTYVYYSGYMDANQEISLEPGLDLHSKHIKNNRQDAVAIIDRFEMPPAEKGSNLDVICNFQQKYKQISSQEIIYPAETYPMNSDAFQLWLGEFGSTIGDSRKCGILYSFENTAYGNAQVIDGQEKMEDTELVVVLPELMNVISVTSGKDVTGCFVGPLAVCVCDEDDVIILCVHVYSLNHKLTFNDDSFNSIVDLTKYSYGVGLYYNSDAISFDSIKLVTHQNVDEKYKSNFSSIGSMLMPPVYKIDDKYIIFKIDTNTQELVATEISVNPDKPSGTIDLPDILLVNHKVATMATPAFADAATRDNALQLLMNEVDSLSEKMKCDYNAIDSCSFNLTKGTKDGILINIDFTCKFRSVANKHGKEKADIFYLVKIYEIAKILTAAIRAKIERVAPSKQSNKNYAGYTL